MLLTDKQFKWFWRDWKACCRLRGWTGEEDKAQRKLLLARAGFSSLTLVDTKLGFDHVLMELQAILHPTDTKIQMSLAAMPRKRLIHAIKELAMKLSPSRVDSAPLGCNYLLPIFIERGWKHLDIDRLSMEELTQLLYTLDNRSDSKERAKVLGWVSNFLTPQPAQAEPEPVSTVDDEDPF